MIRLRHVLGIAVVIMIFVTTLLLHWPIGTLWPLVENRLPSAISMPPPQGSLLAGKLAHIDVTPSQAWPITLGPLSWQWSWPASLQFTLGERQPWQLSGQWRGLDSHWQLSGGDLDAVDLRRWPATLEGSWQGRLTADISGFDCMAAGGGLTSNDMRLLTPSPLTLGNGRLTLTCPPSSPPHLALRLEEAPTLDLSVALDLKAGGASGQLTGHLDADHPLASWWRLVDRDIGFPDISRRIGGG